MMKILTEKGFWEGEVHNIKKNRDRFWCFARASVFVHPQFGEVFISVLRDITHSKQIENNRVLLLQELKMVNRVVLKMNNELNIDVMTEILAKEVAEVNPGSHVAVSLYDESCECVRIRSLIGFDKSLEKIIKIFGKDPRQIKFNPLKLDHIYTQYRTGELLLVKGGMTELAAGQISSEQCRLAEKLMNIGEVYTVGFATDDRAKCRVVIFLKKGDSLKLSSAIETLVTQTSQIIQKRQEENKEKLYHKNIEFLSKTAMQFVELPEGSNVYDFVGEQISSFAGKDSYIVVNSVDSNTGLSMIHSALGSEKLNRILTNTLGRDPVGMEFEAKDINEHYKDGKLHLFPGGLYELLLKAIPKNVCESIENLASINKIYVIDLTNKEQFFGNVVILLTESESELKNKPLIETFVKQASIAILKSQAEEALRIHEAKLNLIINTSPLGICTVDMLGNFITTNPAYEQILGYSKEEFVGKSFFDVTHPEDRPANRKLFQNSFVLKKTGFSIEKRYIRKDGKDILVFVQAIGISDVEGNIKFGTAFIEDISERKQIEDKLLSSERDLSITLNSIGDAVIATNHEGLISRMNPVAEKLTGWLFEEAKGSLLEKVFNISSSHSGGVSEKSGTGGTAHYSVLVTRGGTKIQVSDSRAPIRDNDGEIVGFVLIFRDVTQQLKIEEQLRQSQKMDAVGQLAGGIAHDFNNMLSGIMGCAELLTRRLADNQKSKKYAELIIESSMQAAELTQKLLTFSRKSPLVNEVFDVHDSILKVSEMLNRSIDKGIEIQIDTKAHFSMIHGDQSQIQNAILNLGINARDAMENSGKLYIKTENVDLGKSDIQPGSDLLPGEYIEIDVEDTGFGMSKEIKERVFEPFFTTKLLGKGTGLGLSVTYNSIKENKGFIEIYSEEHIGTVVKLYLPVNINKDLPKEKKEEHVCHGRGTVLVVDDENIVRIMADAQLRDLGYDVLLASDGNMCVDLYKKKYSVIDLVILDIVMPKMNGVDAFYQLKEFNPEVKVLISSGFTNDARISKLIEDGALSFIQKPYRQIDLSKKIADILN